MRIRRPRKWPSDAMQFTAGQIIRTPGGTIYEVQLGGSWRHRPDLERQAAGEGHPTVQKPEVKSYA